MKIVNREGVELELQFPLYKSWEIGDYGTTLTKITEGLLAIDINLSNEDEIESVVFGQYDKPSMTYTTEEDVNNQPANKEKFEVAAQRLKEIVAKL